MVLNFIHLILFFWSLWGCLCFLVSSRPSGGGHVGDLRFLWSDWAFSTSPSTPCGSGALFFSSSGFWFDYGWFWLFFLYHLRHSLLIWCWHSRLTLLQWLLLFACDRFVWRWLLLKCHVLVLHFRPHRSSCGSSRASFVLLFELLDKFSIFINGFFIFISFSASWCPWNSGRSDRRFLTSSTLWAFDDFCSWDLRWLLIRNTVLLNILFIFLLLGNLLGTILLVCVFLIVSLFHLRVFLRLIRLLRFLFLLYLFILHILIVFNTLIINCGQAVLEFFLIFRRFIFMMVVVRFRGFLVDYLTLNLLTFFFRILLVFVLVLATLFLVNWDSLFLLLKLFWFLLGHVLDLVNFNFLVLSWDLLLLL